MPITDSMAAVKNIGFVDWSGSILYDNPTVAGKASLRMYDLGLGREICTKEFRDHC